MSVGETIPLFRLDDEAVLGQKNVWRIAVDAALCTEMEVASQDEYIESTDVLSAARKMLKKPDFPDQDLTDELLMYIHENVYTSNVFAETLARDGLPYAEAVE